MRLLFWGRNYFSRMFFICPNYEYFVNWNMSAIEQKIIALFSPLPFSLKAKIVAMLSELVAKEAAKGETPFLNDDLNTSKEVRKLIEKGEMKLYSEEEYWKKLRP